MASIEELKNRIDLHDLAQRLGLVRPASTGNYKSPHHDDKGASLSVFADGKAFKDFSSEDSFAQGDAINLVRYVEGIDSVPDAMRRLHEIYGISFDKPSQPVHNKEKSLAEFIANKALQNPQGAVAYLRDVRKIPEPILQWAIKRGSLGFNDYASPSKDAGQIGHGGPAAAFICRDWHTNEVKAVDLRFIDPALNGGLKTQAQGEKTGVPWFVCRDQLLKAKTVYIVESAINALFVHACDMPHTAALAIRGTANWKHIDWRFLQGKFVILALDADLAKEDGKRPGAVASWAIYDALVAADVAVMMVDQESWYEAEYNDVADIGQALGVSELKIRLQELEFWAVPGLPGQNGPAGRNRVFLPPHDWSVYWKYRCKTDFTSFVAKIETSEDGSEQPKIEDLCGFRVAALSRVRIQSATATMTGEDDVQPTTLFAASVQVARHGANLQRMVLEDKKLHNLDQWKQLGPVFNQSRFARLINILERTADCGARDAVNFVGVCYRNGKLSVNEGSDCYFVQPEKQCPYHNLSFPSGSPADASAVINAYQETFSHNAALFFLVWGLGGHFKPLLGFWPHAQMEARKGSGKTTLLKRLERTLNMTMFGGQSIQSEFRLLTSISYTTHPVGWEEVSQRSKVIIDRAISMLQESYQYSVTRRGSEMLEYVQCAPVLLAGEEVDAKGLHGKMVRASITQRMGPMMREDLPRFPVREWLHYLVTIDRDTAQVAWQKAVDWLKKGSRAKKQDSSADRMIKNYAAILTAWNFICEFAGMDYRQCGFHDTVRAEMNAHLSNSVGDREVWVWIVETILSEIASGGYRYPYGYDLVEGEDVLIIKPEHMMDHINTTPKLRSFADAVSVKSARIFKAQLEEAGVVAKSGLDKMMGTIGPTGAVTNYRHSRLYALSILKLEEFGVSVSLPEQVAEVLVTKRAANEY